MFSSRVNFHVPLGEHSTSAVYPSVSIICHSHDNTGKVAPGTIGASSMQRQWIGLSSVGDETTVEPLQVSPLYLESVDLEIAFLRRGHEIAEIFDPEEMIRNFIKAFTGIVFAPGQLLVFEFHGHNLKVFVKSVMLLELADQQGRGQQAKRPQNMGILMANTDVVFIKASDSAIKIKASAKR